MAKALPPWIQVDYVLKLTKGNTSEAAKRLGCSRTSVYKVRDFNGYREHDYAHPEQCKHCREQIGPVPEPPEPEAPNEQIIKKLEAFGITREQLVHAETCQSCGCGICGQVEQRLRRFEAILEHKLCDCRCGREHMARGAGGSSGPFGPRRDNRLAMSYASKLRSI